MTLRTVACALALAGFTAGAAGGADAVPFKGTTVTFRVEAGAVKNVAVTASALCLIAGRGGYEIKVIPLAGEAKLDGDGRFKLAADDKGTRVSVTGRVTGATAEGQFEVYFTKSVPGFDPITRMTKFEIASCSAKSPWTARRESP
jgi:hypothetical protein